MRILETIFDVTYLITVITLGILMIRGFKGRAQTRLAGIMAVVLGCGDAFHLVPRVWAQWTNGLEANASALGVGQFITSITMTVFYVLLYYVWKLRYEVQGNRTLDIVVFVLAGLRIALCLAPQNAWTQANAPLSWGIYRNIPFTLLGVLVIVLFFLDAKRTKDRIYRFMWLAITLSFLFYAPVVLFAHIVPAVGALMIPKTCAYVWIVWMGYSDMKTQKS